MTKLVIVIKTHGFNISIHTSDIISINRYKFLMNMLKFPNASTIISIFNKIFSVITQLLMKMKRSLSLKFMKRIPR